MSSIMEENRLEVRRKCYECKRTMVGRKQNYQYDECGLSSVVLTNVLVFHCECGAIVAELPSLSCLHAVIATDLFRKKTLLSGEEFRFLRKWTGYSATELSVVMGVAKETISRWENQKVVIGDESDRLFRLVCFAKILKTTGGSGISDKLIEAARMIKSLNLVDILESLESTFNGSQKMAIDPATLSAACLASTTAVQ